LPPRSPGRAGGLASPLAGEGREGPLLKSHPHDLSYLVETLSNVVG
jgi:hypothetical protein